MAQSAGHLPSPDRTRGERSEPADDRGDHPGAVRLAVDPRIGLL